MIIEIIIEALQAQELLAKLKGGRDLLPIIVEALERIFELNKQGHYYSEDPKSLVKNAIT